MRVQVKRAIFAVI